MKVLIEDFVIRLVSVFLALPVMLVVNQFIEYSIGGLTPYPGGGVDGSEPIFMPLLLVAVYALPVYLFVGIPVSYLIDYISNKLSRRFRSNSYFLKLSIYGLVCIIMIFLFINNEELFSLTPVLLIIVPVLTYFHILYFLRKRL